MKFVFFVLCTLLPMAIGMLGASNGGPRIVEALEEKGFTFLTIKRGAFVNSSLSELNGRPFTVTFKDKEGKRFKAEVKADRKKVHFGKSQVMEMPIVYDTKKTTTEKVNFERRRKITNLNTS